MASWWSECTTTPAFGSTIGHWARFFGQDTAEMVKELGIFADWIQYRLILVRVLSDDVREPQERRQQPQVEVL